MKKIAVARLPIDQTRYEEALFNSASEIQARIIAKRRIGKAVLTSDFLNPKLSNLNLSSLCDCEKASRRLARALIRSENIAICCEYTLDATAAAAALDYALAKTFKHTGHKSQIFFTKSEGGESFSKSFFEKLNRSDRKYTTLICVGAPSRTHKNINAYKTLLTNSGSFCDAIVINNESKHLFDLSNRQKNSVYSHINPNREGSTFEPKSISLTILSQLLIVSLRKVAAERNIEGGEANLGYLTPFGASSIQSSLGDIREPIVRAFVKQGLKRMNGDSNSQWSAYRQRYLKNSELISSEALNRGLSKEVASKAFRGMTGFPLVKFLQAETAKDASRYLMLLGDERAADIKQEREDFIVADFMAKAKDETDNTIFVYLKDAQPSMLEPVARGLQSKYGKAVLISCPTKSEVRDLPPEELRQLQCDIFKDMASRNIEIDAERVLLVEKSIYSYAPSFSILHHKTKDIEAISMIEAASLARASIFGMKNRVYEQTTSGGLVTLDLRSHRKPKLTISKVAAIHTVCRIPSSLQNFGMISKLEELGVSLRKSDTGCYELTGSFDEVKAAIDKVKSITDDFLAIDGNEIRPIIFSDGVFPENRILDKATLYEILDLEPFGEKFPYPQYEFTAKVERMRTVGGVLELKLNFRGTGFDGIWQNFERSHQHGAIKSGEEYTFVARPVLRTKNSRESIALMIVDSI